MAQGQKGYIQKYSSVLAVMEKPKGAKDGEAIEPR
jgi:hypothetical protein